MLLLDTHVALWTLDDNPRLGAQARDRIATSPAVHVSAATIWELEIKAMLGKLRVPDGLRDHFREQGFLELAITGAHAEAIRHYPQLVQQDPFDRLLVAQASEARLDLLTTDRVLLGLDLDFVIDAKQ